MADDLLPMAPRLARFRDTPVILDADLAEVFGVTTGRLNEAVKRHEARFEGYSFLIPLADLPDLISQDAISSGHGGRRKPVRAFTEHGVVMAATVLNSDRAVAASRRIIEAFVATKRATLPAAPAMDRSFLARLRERMEVLMQAEVDAATGRTMQGQTQEFIIEGLANLRARLKKSGLENEETEARILRTLAEADEARARADTQREMTTRQRIKNQANALRLMIEAELVLSGGEVGTLLAVLRDLGGD